MDQIEQFAKDLYKSTFHPSATNEDWEESHPILVKKHFIKIVKRLMEKGYEKQKST